MPRTRAIRALRTTVYFGTLALTTGTMAMVPAAGDQWWLAFLVAAVVLTGLVLLARLLLRRLDKAALAALAKDWAGLTAEQRALPFGVVAGKDGALLLPTKLGMVIVAWLAAVGLVALGVGLVFVDDPAAKVAGAVIAALGCWTGVLAWWITGTKITLTRDGIETRVGPRRSYRWIDVPELKGDGQTVILKAAGKKRPRVWLRAGLLEASAPDLVAMIRRQRGW